MFKFYLIDYTVNPIGITTEIEEPLNVDELELIIERDNEFHGIFFYPESFNNLVFIGDAFSLIVGVYESYGIDATLKLRITYECNSVITEIALLTLDLSELEKNCDPFCKVSVGLQDGSPLGVFRNRYKTKVNLESLQGFDGATLPNYSALGEQMSTNKAQLLYKNRWTSIESTPAAPLITFTHTKDNGQPIYYSDRTWLNYTFPFNVVLEELPESYSDGGYNGGGDDTLPATMPTNYNFEYKFNSLLKCNAILTYNINLTGGVNSSGDGVTGNVRIALVHLRPKDIGGLEIKEVINNITLDNMPDWTGANTYSDAFNAVGVGSFAIQPGDVIYIAYQVFNVIYPATGGSGIVANPQEVEIYFNPFGYANFDLFSECGESLYKGFMINEALSRTTEIITNDELRVYSEYYGRTDSEPYTTIDDGCGSLKSITNGLFLRNTLIADDQQPEFTITMDELIMNLKGIDNIGFGIEDDPNRINKQLIRVEPAEYFYSNFEMLNCSGANDLMEKVKPQEFIQNLRFGYRNYETEETLGNDCIHGSREYRSTLKTIKNTLEILIEWIASHYAIEFTRRESFKSLTDYRYDNFTFVMQNKRVEISDDSEAQRFICEYPATTSNDNIRIVQNRRNIKLSPIRNIIRHFKNIFKNYLPTLGSYIFSSGNANYKAKIQLFNGDCVDEKVNDIGFNGLYENQELDQTILQSAKIPYTRNEDVIFTYPISFEDFQAIKSNPYGFITYICNEEKTGYLRKISYNIKSGLTKFELIRRNE